MKKLIMGFIGNIFFGVGLGLGIGIAIALLTPFGERLLSVYIMGFH